MGLIGGTGSAIDECATRRWREAAHPNCIIMPIAKSAKGSGIHAKSKFGIVTKFL